MQTYSHFLITVVGQDRLKRYGFKPNLGAILLGSVLPDIPFGLLTAVYMAYYTWVAPLPPTTQDSVMTYLHLELYFTDPLWIASHNLFHAPLILLGLIGLGHIAMRRGYAWGQVVFWFALGASLHSFIDIFTHHNDGPLLLFPFDWTIRFNSPISYWHPDYYGSIFIVLEHLLDFGLVIYLLQRWISRLKS